MNLDLDHDMLQLLPPYYRDISDYEQVTIAEKAEFDLLEEAVRKALANFFIQTADESTIALWENALHIMANPSAEELDYRRQRVLNRLSMQPPFTLTFLYRKLDAIIGPGKWDCSVDYPNYRLSIRSSAENQLYFSELAALIRAIKPAHIVFVNVPLFTSGILITETVRKRSYSYNYRLGAWALGSAPFRSANAETIVKESGVSSAEEQLFSTVAENAASLAASACINESFSAQEITSECNSARMILHTALQNLKFWMRTAQLFFLLPAFSHWMLRRK